MKSLQKQVEQVKHTKSRKNFVILKRNSSQPAEKVWVSSYMHDFTKLNEDNPEKSLKNW